MSHVLGRFTKEEQEKMDMTIAQAEYALLDWIRGDDFAELMNNYN